MPFKPKLLSLEVCSTRQGNMDNFPIELTASWQRSIENAKQKKKSQTNVQAGVVPSPKNTNPPVCSSCRKEVHPGHPGHPHDSRDHFEAKDPRVDNFRLLKCGQRGVGEIGTSNDNTAHDTNQISGRNTVAISVDRKGGDKTPDLPIPRHTHRTIDRIRA